MKDILERLKRDALAAIETAETLADLQDVEVKFLGRKSGSITNAMKGLKDVAKSERPVMGQLFNAMKDEVTAAYEAKKTALGRAEMDRELMDDYLDLTVPGQAREIGTIHPLNQVQYEVERIFQQMGYSIMDGPEAESEYYNFEGLNIPAHHPARDMQDTFFIKQKPDKKHGRLVLRTHTSPTGQMRAMEKWGAPLRSIAPGRCFRYEATDASHDSTFSQVEGMLIDKEISLAHLKGVMTTFLAKLFGKPIKIRFRPGYFPFTEPSVELDVSCIFCDEKGCRTCGQSGWIEFMGCGMTHPNVLRAGGIDPTKYQGWAFGFGLTRLTMMRYGINDIRLLASGDVRFLKQF